MGVEPGEELVSKSGSKEEEMSETKCIICLKEFRTVAEWRGHFKMCIKCLVCENVVRSLKLSSGMKGM